MMESLSVCPFCGGEAVLETERERQGYGEHESLETYHVVVCSKCKSRATRYHQKHLINFTSATVSDFRHNPVLRAKVEDEYEEYCKQVQDLAVTAWERRA